MQAVKAVKVVTAVDAALGEKVAETEASTDTHTETANVNGGGDAATTTAEQGVLGGADVGAEVAGAAAALQGGKQQKLSHGKVADSLPDLAAFYRSLAASSMSGFSDTDAWPREVTGKVLCVEWEVVTGKLKRQVPYLAHLAANAEVALVEIDVQRYLSASTRAAVRGKAAQREKARRAFKQRVAASFSGRGKASEDVMWDGEGNIMDMDQAKKVAAAQRKDHAEANKWREETKVGGDSFAGGE